MFSRIPIRISVTDNRAYELSNIITVDLNPPNSNQQNRYIIGTDRVEIELIDDDSKYHTLWYKVSLVIAFLHSTG